MEKLSLSTLSNHLPQMGYRLDPKVRAWLAEVGQLLLEALLKGSSRDDPVLRYARPEALYEAFEAHVGLTIPPGETPHAPEQVLVAVQDVLRRAVRSDHPRFFNQNWAGADPVGVVGDWMTALLNTTAATYEMSAIFTLMENELLARMSELAGLSVYDGSRNTQAGAHGMFTPGGATSNLYALHLARAFCQPEALMEGHFNCARLVAFTSQQSHYSLDKAVAMVGLGRSSLVRVPCDEVGRMRVDKLNVAVRSCQSEGKIPFFVNATAGTTVTGAFDDIDAIANLAEEVGMWLHVDASYGGAVLFSNRFRHLLEGSKRARSLAWNAHKMMGMPQQCSVLLLRNPDLLRRAFAAGADYIFQRDKNDADQDLGDLTLMCGRRPDGFKLWLTWKMRGEQWFSDRVEHALRLAEELEAMVRDHPSFVLAHPRTFANVGFWWVPEELRPLRLERLSEEKKLYLHQLAPLIKDAMQREGSTMLGYQPLGDLPNFFRLLVISPDVQKEDIETTLSTIDRLGSLLARNSPV